MSSDGSNFSGNDIPSYDSRAETSRAGRSRTRINTRSALIGKDAFRVPKYYKKRKDVVDESSGEEFDFTGVDLTHTRKSSKGKGKQKERTPEADHRVRKRRKVAHDLSFLETTSVQSTAPTSLFAVPSADLLRCIHHFACNYYSERGQLSHTYYKEKAERRAAKLAAKKAENKDADSQEDASEAETEPPKKNKRGLGEKRRDMYKTLDGSALLAIGMLLQEHVARLLTPRVPDGWEDVLDESDEEMEVDEDGNDPGTGHQDLDDEEEDDENAGSEDDDENKEKYDEGDDEKDEDEDGKDEGEDEDGKDEDEDGKDEDEDGKDEDEDEDGKDEDEDEKDADERYEDDDEEEEDGKDGDEDEDGKDEEKDADERYEDGDEEDDNSARDGGDPGTESENDLNDPGNPGKFSTSLLDNSNEEDGDVDEEEDTD